MEAFLKRDRMVVLCILIVLALSAWAYMIYLAQGMSRMHMSEMRIQPWDIPDLVYLFFMWAIMMVAMMIPSAAPMILMFSTINRKRSDQSAKIVSTQMFLLGYFFVWSGFSIGAALAQWGMHAVVLISPMMVINSSLLSGSLLVVAGIYQWTSLKYSCLMHCKSPFDFLMHDWRSGERGASRPPDYRTA